MSDPRESVFGAPPWISAIVDTYGFDVKAAVLRDTAGRSCAGLACAEIHDFRGDRLVSLPFCDYLDPLLDGDDDWNELVAPLLARALPLQLRVLRSDAPLDDARFARTSELAWHGTDLARDEDEILASLRPGVRQHLRSAHRRGVSVRFGTEFEDVRPSTTSTAGRGSASIASWPSPSRSSRTCGSRSRQREAIAVGLRRTTKRSLPPASI